MNQDDSLLDVTVAQKRCGEGSSVTRRRQTCKQEHCLQKKASCTHIPHEVAPISIAALSIVAHEDRFHIIDMDDAGLFFQSNAKELGPGAIPRESEPDSSPDSGDFGPIGVPPKGVGGPNYPEYVTRSQALVTRGVTMLPLSGHSSRWTGANGAVIAGRAQTGHPARDSAQCGRAEGVRPPDGVDQP
jgi:hypothetical protein